MRSPRKLRYDTVVMECLSCGRAVSVSNGKAKPHTTQDPVTLDWVLCPGSEGLRAIKKEDE